ncbi:MAG: zinc dependent phospholipase C family protein [Bacilli bacterium]|nr:zinc dependent phospholipase C family protein [Bacilli bacterium]
MPSTVTHAYMARDIYDKLNNNLKNKFKDKLDYYVTYSQGPDVFFFYPFIPPFIRCNHIRKFAGVVHRNKVNELFISLVNEVKRTKDFDQFIYLAGLVTHYVGDTTCHPFVNYKDWFLRKETKKNKDYHFVTEAYIDNYVLNMKGEDYKKYKAYKLLKNYKNIKIQEMLDKCFLDVFEEKNIGKDYYLSLSNMRFLFHFVRYDPYKIKYTFYSIIYHILPFLHRDIRYFSYNFDLNSEDSEYFLNLKKDKWFNIKKKEITYNKSFLELYTETVDKSKMMIEQLYDYIYNDKYLELESFFGNLSYANGLPVKSNKKKTTS